jgi:TPR repeat protein
MHRLVGTVALASVLCVAGGCTHSLSDGNAANKANDFQSAMAIYRPLADAGDADAMHRISIMYKFGQGVAADEQEALMWDRRAADHGSAWGQYCVAMDYYGKHDDTSAMQWFRLAADQAHPAATIMVGLLYAQGRGVEKDAAEASRWFNLAMSRHRAEH